VNTPEITIVDRLYKADWENASHDVDAKTDHGAPTFAMVDPLTQRLVEAKGNFRISIAGLNAEQFDALLFATLLEVQSKLEETENAQ
jgi:hypothetical protein